MKKLAILLGLAWAACVPKTTVKADPSKMNQGPTTQPSSELMKRLDRSCSGCHDGSDGRPALEASSPLDKRTALRAALMISAARMPPSRPMPEQDARFLIQELCKAAADHPDLCIKSYDPAGHAPLIYDPKTIRNAIDFIAARPAKSTSKATNAEVLLEQQGAAEFTDLTLLLNPTIQALTAIISDERCGARVGPERVRCFDDTLHLELMRVPAPPPEGAE